MFQYLTALMFLLLSVRMTQSVFTPTSRTELKDAVDAYIKSPPITNTYGEISDWDISNVTDMSGMFESVKLFNEDISQWDVSNVTDMYAMFLYANSFNGDISQWNVSNVTDMLEMFRYANSFNGDISQWDVSNVTDMRGMFGDAYFFNSDISQWDVSNLMYMSYMFYKSTSFVQELCWDISNGISMYHMFTDSPGTRANYPDCLTVTPSPTRIQVAVPTFPPSRNPTDNPTSAPSVPLSFLNRPLSIMSGLSTENEKWCIHPANNYLHEGTRIVIGTCNMNWGVFQWMFDFEGKLINFKDPYFCIHMEGNRLMIRKCVDGLRNQLWRYNINRMLFAKNGRKGAVVRDYVASEKTEVKNQVYHEGDATDAATWNLQYVGGDILDMHPYINFRIVSDLTTNDQKWCMHAANNAIATIGTKLVLSTCKNWKPFKWMMDNQGKIKNVMDPTKCMTRMGKRIQINECTDNLITQRWAYNIIDKKLSFLINGQVQVTVERSKAFVNAQVKALPSVVPGPSHQTWVFEEI